jgi:replicative superfamily II helicase
MDLLATVITGSGKTGYLTMLMLVVREISADETLVLGKRLPKDPAMIVVCPTKALEEDMVCTFHKVVT